jgi:hypothetical protein
VSVNWYRVVEGGGLENLNPRFAPFHFQTAEKRDRLKNLSLEDIPTDAVFGEVRNISRVFQEGLTSYLLYKKQLHQNFLSYYQISI